MTRQEAIAQAEEAALRAVYLAGEAERYAANPDHRGKSAALAQAATAHADASRAFTAIAQALPETEA